ncbi:DUF6986 family protein [Sandaracinus amylolyticus]|nr:aldolase/citrate lyase family protein [Sandaracinus amylolyticus]
MLEDDPDIARSLAALAPTKATPVRRQPIHVVYAGAPRFTAELSTKLGAIALRALDEHASDPLELARALGNDPRSAARVHERVRQKLEREPVEDFRIDFEDGYGPHSDDEEDADARRAAAELVRGLDAGTLPPSIGIRIRPLEGESARRALRTLELFVTEAGRLPSPFVVTLPKVESEDALRLLARALDRLEAQLGLARGAITIEAMMETPRALLDARGACPLSRWPDACDGRLSGVHLGAYDLSASIDVPAPHQTLHHPICVDALLRAQLALAGRDVHVSDGATTRLPLAPKNASHDDARAAVHGGWREHAEHVREAIALGVWQGWDLHPAQIVARLGALHGFFLGSLADATARMANFRAERERATRVGATFDDAATGRGLRGFFARGLACGALTRDDLAAAGLDG